jgi:hypothetical protein
MKPMGDVTEDAKESESVGTPTGRTPACVKCGSSIGSFNMAGDKAMCDCCKVGCDCVSFGRQPTLGSTTGGDDKARELACRALVCPAGAVREGMRFTHSIGCDAVTEAITPVFADLAAALKREGEAAKARDMEHAWHRVELEAVRAERDDYKRAWQRDLEKGREFLAERDEARERAIEECAKRAEDCYTKGSVGHACEACAQAAARIRALAPVPTAEADKEPT